MSRATRPTDAQVRLLAARVRAAWVRRTGDPTLAGRCDDVSYALLRRLRRHGLGPKHALFIVGEFSAPHPLAHNHVWLRVYGAILDCTATQFGDYPEIWWPADVSLYRETCVCVSA